MGLFNFRTKPQQTQTEERIVMPSNYSWGMTQRAYCQTEEWALEDLAELLNSGNVNNFNKSLSLAPVFSAIELISNSIASMPMYVKSNNVVQNHSFISVLRNGMLTYFVLIKQLITDLLLHGNAFAYLKKSGNIVTDIIYLPNSDVYVDYDIYKHKLQYKVTNYFDVPNVIEPKNMIHLVKNSEDGVLGKGFKHYGLKVIRQLQQTQDAAGQLFKDGLNTAGYYSAEQPITQKQQKDVLDTIKEQQSSGNRQVFLPVKYNFISAGNTANDSQLIEHRLFSLQEIARYFNVSPILLGDLSKGNTNSVEDAQLLLLSNCLLPIINIVEQEFTRKCLESPYIIDMDERELLRTSQVKQATYLKTLTSGGIMTINEARDILGLSRKEDCDELYIPFTDTAQNKISNNTNID